MEREREHKRIGFYDYTVVLTYTGFLISIYGIMQVFHGRFWHAIICLMLAGVCDMFDGAVAATKKDRTAQGKRFGIQIDSLSDLVSFGVFPAFFVYELSGRGMIVGLICCVYALCALIRLAYYNVLEEERQDRMAANLKNMADMDVEECVMEEEKKVYLGLPVTVIAITLPALFFFFDDSILHHNAWLGGLLAVTAILFVTPIEIEKPKLMGKIVLILLALLEMFGMAWLAVMGVA